MKSAQTLILTIVALSIFLMDSASGWSISRPFAARGSSVANTQKTRTSPQVDGKSSLNYRTGVEEDETMGGSAVISPTYSPQSVNPPSKWELPRHSPPPAVAQRERLLWDAEMVTGRVAMVAAIVLLVSELTTGMSLLDQVSGVFL